MADGALSGRNDSATSAWLALGSLLFAGTIMFTLGIFHAFEGLAAIIKNEFFVVSGEYAFRVDVTTWGWIQLFLGILVAAAGIYLFVGKMWARIVAIGVAMLSTWANFLSIPYYPFWSILMIALNILVIWAIAAYGRELAD